MKHFKPVVPLLTVTVATVLGLGAFAMRPGDDAEVERSISGPSGRPPSRPSTRG